MKINTTDKTVHKVLRKMDERSLKGQEVYKNTMSDEVEKGLKGFNDFVIDVQEELMDALLYLESVKLCGEGYNIYHIPAINKVGLAKDIIDRVENQQGYEKGEYSVLVSNIPSLENARIVEKAFQAEFGCEEAHEFDLVDKALEAAKTHAADALNIATGIEVTDEEVVHDNIRIGKMFKTIKGVTVTFPIRKTKFAKYVDDNYPITIVNGASSHTFRDDDLNWLKDNIYASGFDGGATSYIYWKAANKYFKNK